MRSIGVVTTSRSDYSSLLPVLKAIESDSELRLLLFVSGTHLLSEFGETVNEIEEDGLIVTDRINVPLGSGNPRDIVKAIEVGISQFADSFTKNTPDILMIVGDRFELLSVMCAATPLLIPVAHISGGDITEGAIDNQVRHAITKMSHLHFAGMKIHGDRLIQMGEEEWRVVVTGDPALDSMNQIELLSRSELARSLGMELESPLVLVSFHPTTLGELSVATEVDSLLLALSRIQSTLVFTYPNADAYHQIIIDRFRQYVDSSPTSGLFFNFGQTKYYSLMAHADVMVGNSSSGLFEAPSFKLPVINVGDRQRGRIRERNVIDVNVDAEDIYQGILRGLQDDFKNSLVGLQNPYGDGKATGRILEVLKNIPLGSELLQKRFIDMNSSTGLVGNCGNR